MYTYSKRDYIEWGKSSFTVVDMRNTEFICLLILERVRRGGEWETEREKYWFVVPLIYALIGCYLCVPWSDIEPTTLVYWDGALTNWATLCLLCRYHINKKIGLIVTSLPIYKHCNVLVNALPVFFLCIFVHIKKWSNAAYCFLTYPFHTFWIYFQGI